MSNGFTYKELLDEGFLPYNFYSEDEELRYDYGGIIYSCSYDDEYNVYRKKDNHDFHLGRVEHSIVCSNCGSDEFQVGQGLYFTAIKCKCCKWEMLIHEG